MENPENFKVIHLVSALTHAHPRTLLGCDIYIAVMFEIWNGQLPRLSLEGCKFER